VKILLVDDSRTMRMIVMRTLRQAGYGGHEIVQAENGIQALEVIQTEQPDLVLCDWNMPEMNGLELLAKLREQGNNIRFGFITSESSPQMRGAAESTGSSFLISKPFTPESFREALEPVMAAG